MGLLGVGVVTLLGQAARKAFALPFEGFWIVVGAGFVLGGLWHIYELDIPLAPILLFGLGALLVGVALVKRRWEEDEDDDDWFS
jgi:hypothetical protein